MASPTYVSSASAASNTITFPTHQAGDLILVMASNHVGNSGPIPVIPSGFTFINRMGINNESNPDTVLAYKIATSSSETSGTWTNATRLVVSVFRDVHPISPIRRVEAASNELTPFFSLPVVDSKDAGSTIVVMSTYSNGTLITPPGLGSLTTAIIDTNNSYVGYLENCPKDISFTNGTVSTNSFTYVYYVELADNSSTIYPYCSGAAYGTTSATVPTHVTGDYIIACAHNLSSSTIPTLPSGWTLIGNYSDTFTNKAVSYAYKVATSSSETSGTWTNATKLSVFVYKNVLSIPANVTSRVAATNSSFISTGDYGTLPAPSHRNYTTAIIWAFGATDSNYTSTAFGPDIQPSDDFVSTQVDKNIATTNLWENFGGGKDSALFYAHREQVYPSSGSDSFFFSVLQLEGPEPPIGGFSAMTVGATTVSSTVQLTNSNAPSFINSNVGTTTATLGAHQAGDLILVFAFRDGSALVPSIPAGFTSITSGSGNLVGGIVAYKIATSSSETVGTWTNATSVMAQVFRYIDSVTPIGVFANTNGASVTVSYPNAGTMNKTDGSSTVVRFGGHRSTNTNLQNPPTGHILSQNSVDATDEVSGFFQRQATSAGNLSVAVSGTSSGWFGATVELRGYFVPITGRSENTLGTITVLANDSIGGLGGLSSTLGSIGISSASNIAIRANSSMTIGATSISSTSTLSIRGTLSTSVGTITTASTSRLSIAGTSSNTISFISIVSDIKRVFPLSVSMTLGEVFASSTSSIAITGQFGMVIDGVTSYGESIISAKGIASSTLGDITITSTSGVGISAISSMVIDVITISSESNITLSASANIPITINTSSTSTLDIKAEGNTSVFITSDSFGRVLIVAGASSLISAIISASKIERDPYTSSETTGGGDTFQTSGGSSDWPYEFSTFTPSDDPYRS